MTDEEYTAAIERDLIGRRWVLRVRYVTGTTESHRGAVRKKYATFVLVPHNGEMFGAVCDTIERAIARHREGKIELAEVRV